MLSIGYIWIDQAKVNAIANQSNRFDGSIYEFVFSSSEITKPINQTSKRDGGDWVGRIYFVGGKYAYVMMKKKRAYLNDPNNEDKLGYYSDAGTYTISDDTLVLTKEISLNPFEVGRSERYRIKEQDGQLHLFQKMIPNIHNMSEGQTHIVFQKLQ